MTTNPPTGIRTVESTFTIQNIIYSSHAPSYTWKSTRVELGDFDAKMQLDYLDRGSWVKTFKPGSPQLRVSFYRSGDDIGPGIQYIDDRFYFGRSDPLGWEMTFVQDNRFKENLENLTGMDTHETHLLSVALLQYATHEIKPILDPQTFQPITKNQLIPPMYRKLGIIESLVQGCHASQYHQQDISTEDRTMFEEAKRNMLDQLLLHIHHI